MSSKENPSNDDKCKNVNGEKIKTCKVVHYTLKRFPNQQKITSL